MCLLYIFLYFYGAHTQILDRSIPLIINIQLPRRHLGCFDIKHFVPYLGKNLHTISRLVYSAPFNVAPNFIWRYGSYEPLCPICASIINFIHQIGRCLPHWCFLFLRGISCALPLHNIVFYSILVYSLSILTWNFLINVLPFVYCVVLV